MKTTSSQQQAGSICGRHLLAAGVFIVGLMACFAIGVSTAQAQSYSVKNMGILDGMKACEPAAMNNAGQIAGTATAGEEHAAFRYYYNPKEEEMKDVGGAGSRGFAINPSGIVVGDIFVSSLKDPISHAAAFSDRVGVVDLGVLKGMVFSRANGINGLQQVVGYSGLQRDSVESRAFIWTAKTGMMDIGTLGGSYAQAMAINDAGFVTGTAGVNSWVKSGDSVATHAFVYQPPRSAVEDSRPMRDLGTLGGNHSYGTAINASNEVVGYSTMKADGRVHAFFHGGKMMIDLGALEKEGFYNSAALAINNANQVVGVSYVQPGETKGFTQVAFVWNRDTSEMINLNSLIGEENAKAIWLLSAVAINDSGQIAASAYDYANDTVIAVLLIPSK